MSYELCMSVWSSDLIFADLGEMEDRRVVIFGRAEEMPVLAIGRKVDGRARPLQRRLELRTQRGFVLDNQNPHSDAFPLRTEQNGRMFRLCIKSERSSQNLVATKPRFTGMSGFAADDPAGAGIDIDDDDLAAVHEFQLVEHPPRVELQIGRAHV